MPQGYRRHGVLNVEQLQQVSLLVVGATAICTRGSLRPDAPEEAEDVRLEHLRGTMNLAAAFSRVLFIEDDGRLFFLKNRHGMCGSVDDMADPSAAKEPGAPAASQYHGVPLRGDERTLQECAQWIRQSAAAQADGECDSASELKMPRALRSVAEARRFLGDASLIRHAEVYCDGSCALHLKTGGVLTHRTGRG